MKTRTAIFLRSSAATLALGLVLAASASASPAWKFNGTELSGTETVVGAAIESSMTIPGMTTTCEHFLYNMEIQNSGGTGEGELSEVPLFDCSTTAEACTVEAIEAEELPWSTHLTTIAGKNYLIIEGIHVSILYGGEECAIGGLTVPVEGTAGGEVDNGTESATFNSETFEATGTELTAFGQSIEWNGVFPTEAFEWHREESLGVS